MLILRCLCGQWNPDKTGCHKQENDQFVRTSLEFRTLQPFAQSQIQKAIKAATPITAINA